MNDFFNLVQSMQRKPMQRRASRVVGPGDGKSDSVPAGVVAKNGDVAPAMLSQGEFIMKADIVSKLGAGATEAGFERLDELVELIEKMDVRMAASFMDIMVQFGEQMVGED